MYLIIRCGKRLSAQFEDPTIRNIIGETVIDHISGTATDYLAFFGFASIKIAVSVKYVAPVAPENRSKA